MKLSKYIKYGALAMALLAGTSACDSGFQQLNQDPNNPTHATPQLVMPYVEQQTANIVHSYDLSWYSGGIWVQQLAEIQYSDEDRYNIAARTSVWNGTWDVFYTDIQENLKKVRAQAASANDNNLMGIVEILSVYNWQNATDLWGPIPYSQALEGDLSKANIQPQFDTQANIYKDLIARLKTAVPKIDPSAAAPFTSQDLIYGGDMMKWKKFGGSLLLRLYMRLAKLDAATAEAGIKMVLGDPTDYPIFTSDADNAEFGYTKYPYDNPFADQGRTRNDFCISATTVDTLEALKDPRLRIYATVVSDSATKAQLVKSTGYPYQGVTNASQSNSLQLNKASFPGYYFYSPSTPGFLLTYPEVMFIKAEAAVRGWISDDPATDYNDAIQASFNMFTDARIQPVMSDLTGSVVYNHQSFNSADYPSGLTDTDYQNYISQADVAFKTGASQAAQLHQIGLQKWIALFGQGYEAWTCWRRTGYPFLKANPGGQGISNKIPSRMIYPPREATVNGSNYNTAKSILGGDGLYQILSWAK
ncbi:MAG TPA: SusD/RagB family nutrient-binding outer membrane lipoprotein [Balneolales bacterium]|nr:SusD/RagB family nutrient-binding outer membrane lipoprotein [Balneolales bacterium]